MRNVDMTPFLMGGGRKPLLNHGELLVPSTLDWLGGYRYAR